MRNPSTLIRILSIVQDRTNLQRMEQKKARQELNNRTAAGEKHLRIIQRAGISIIITTHRPTSASTLKNTPS